MKTNNQTILSFETSCDDTCIAIVKYSDFENFNILCNINIHQKNMCDKYLGVVPDVAARNHLINLNVSLQQALQQANLTLNEIDIISCTIGPGLIGSLIITEFFAKSMALLLKKTFIPVHHIEGHIEMLQESPEYLAIIISGGHTQIIHVKSAYECIEICCTRDDAVGEIIDKIGRAMNLPTPSGMHIEKLALKNIVPIHKENIKIVLPNKLEFSFSGLKTYFLNMITDDNHAYVCDLLQQTIAYNLNLKIKMAMKKTKCTKVIVCGGVSANKYIRTILYYCIFADSSLCTDNALMINLAAYKHFRNNYINDIHIQPFASKKLQHWFDHIRDFISK